VLPFESDWRPTSNANLSFEVLVDKQVKYMYDWLCFSRTACPYNRVRWPDWLVDDYFRILKKIQFLKKLKKSFKNKITFFDDELNTSCNALTDNACSKTKTHEDKSGVTFYLKKKLYL
jgi:hypothetical protein